MAQSMQTLTKQRFGKIFGLLSPFSAVISFIYVLFFMEIVMLSQSASETWSESRGVIQRTVSPVRRTTYHGALELLNSPYYSEPMIIGWPLIFIGLAIVGGISAWKGRMRIAWATVFIMAVIAILAINTIGPYLAPPAFFLLISVFLLQRSGAETSNHHEPRKTIRVYKQLKTMVFGRNRATSLRVLLLSIGLFSTIYIMGITGIGFDILAMFFETVRNVAGIDAPYVVALALVGLAAANAYYNDSLVMSWALVFAPLFAFMLLTPTLVELSTIELIVGAAGLGLVYTAILGTVGYVLGAVMRRLAP